MAPKLHPLDPLTPDEISKSSSIIRQNIPNFNGIFNSITLKEPEKVFLIAHWNEEKEVDRKAFVILIENGTGKVIEILVNLTKEEIESKVLVPDGNQPTLTPEDCFEAERITKSDQGVKLRCAKLGFPDMETVVGDPW